MATPELEALLRSARELNGAGRYPEALEAARLALQHAPEDRDARRLAALLLSRHPAAARPEWSDAIARLVVDPAIDPMMVAAAGWRLLLAPGGSVGAHSGAALARSLEADAFALDLLDQAYVTRLDTEHRLTALRRWLLLSGEWPDFPRLVAALTAQAGQNGGAWLFDPDERQAIDASPGTAIAAAYRPPPPAAIRRAARPLPTR